MESSYRLSQLAKSDLKKLTRYSVQHFGERQTDHYLDEMFLTFEKLSNRKEMGRPYQNIPSGRSYLRWEYESHVIYFRRRHKDIFITRILHSKMLPEKHF